MSSTLQVGLMLHAATVVVRGAIARLTVTRNDDDYRLLANMVIISVTHKLV